MLNKLKYLLLALVLTCVAACGDTKKTTLLNDLSGVWKANDENALITLHYADKKVRLLFGDTFIPVTVGDIDEENGTVNFNVNLNTGKQAIWTFRQVWNDKEKTNFHLGFTLHDGAQEEASFVRKVSTSDLNHIASLEPKATNTTSPATVTQAAATTSSNSEAIASIPAQTQQTPEASLPVISPEVAASAAVGTFAPSFDCTKASTGLERLICSHQELAALDVELMRVYKQYLDTTKDKNGLKKEQSEWRKNERDACSTVDCVAKAYRSRIDDLESESRYLAKPAEFR